MLGCVYLEEWRWFKLFIQDVLNSRGLARINDPFVVKIKQMSKSFSFIYSRVNILCVGYVYCWLSYSTLSLYHYHKRQIKSETWSCFLGVNSNEMVDKGNTRYRKRPNH